ncbi:MAG: cytochrome c-type biogenesis protein CcmH [Pelagibacteraceae bacterium TMED246]|nr:MAG: cytochrome c-type biogenesis protein CcmH [Pelagibacteraceae bacterium TMED246]|tara:strand:- start:2652 stop:3026 length:375 start_codon:yes stop_codon:yes gene_type:complete
MKIIKYLLIILCFIGMIKNLSASEPDKLSLKITKNLRCIICQGQSVYDSQSEFALSLKVLINKKIEDGFSEREIYNYLVEKYGEWIVYDPILSKKTYILWFLPILLFLIGGAIIINKFIIKKKI